MTLISEKVIPIKSNAEVDLGGDVDRREGDDGRGEKVMLIL